MSERECNLENFINFVGTYFKLLRENSNLPRVDTIGRKHERGRRRGLD